MNKEAIFSDGTKQFRNPTQIEPYGTVVLRIRVSREDNVDIYLKTDKSCVSMQRSSEQGLFCYYEASLTLEREPVRYYYILRSNEGVFSYDRMGLCDGEQSMRPFCMVPGFTVPDWMQGAVMYQIFVDRFRNGNSDNDVCDGEYPYINQPVSFVQDWNRPPETLDVANFYGGDLQGVYEKLDYLKSLGVEVLYFNPIFESPSNHKYDTKDYDYIDSHLAVKDDGQASNEYFASFMGKAHEMGFKVIIDGVFNHCGSFHKWMETKKDYFNFYEDGSYEGWWGFDTLPKLNYEGSKQLEEEVLQIGAKWLSPPYNVDGWRLDVAADLGHSKEYNHYFWKSFRKAVKTANPQAVILAEHYGDAREWLQGDEWDTLMNYDAFMDPVTDFFTGMEKHSDAYNEAVLGDGVLFENRMKEAMTMYMTPSLYRSMNQLSNHDHSRFLTRTNHVVGRAAVVGSEKASEGIQKCVLRQATLLQMTWPGAPTLYYGDEVGVVGFTDPDSRRTYPWGNEDKELLSFFRDVIFLHKSYSVLKDGALIFLDCGSGYISYARFNDNTCVVVAFNAKRETIELSLPVWKAGVAPKSKMRRIFLTQGNGYSILMKETDINSGYLSVSLGPNGGIVFSS